MMDTEKRMEKKIMPLPFHVNDTRKIKRYTPQSDWLNLTRHTAASAFRFWLEIHSKRVENGTLRTALPRLDFVCKDQLEKLLSSDERV